LIRRTGARSIHEVCATQNGIADGNIGYALSDSVYNTGHVQPDSARQGQLTGKMALARHPVNRI
jgi:hypothetical protein